MERRCAGFQIVSIPSPYDDWTDPQVRKVFCDVIALRLKGYTPNYGEGVFPLDGADFVGTHHLLCREEGGNLVPVMGFRSTTCKQSQRHGLPFGGLSLVRVANAVEHLQAIERIVTSCQERDIPIAYFASWTMLPDIQSDQKLKGLVHEIFRAMTVLAHLDTGTRIVAGCTERFRVNRLVAPWGFEPLRDENGILDPVRVPFLLNEPVQLMYLSHFTAQVLREIEPWRNMWDQRVILTGRFTDRLPGKQAEEALLDSVSAKRKAA